MEYPHPIGDAACIHSPIGRMTEQPSTPPALVFAKEDCACKETLFSLKYLRTHRAGSLKLIRCFPHCCPSHSFGNFCSTSIDLKVTGATTDNVAYVHFQPTTDRILEPNDIIDAAIVVNNTRSMDNLKGEWIPSLYHYYHETRNETIYHFNQNNTFGWHYGWVGTSTKAHRTCPHRLVGYMFSSVSGHAKPMLRVVHATMSPAFIVMSYRRACYFCQKHRVPSSLPLDASPMSSACECEGEFNISTHHPAHTQPYPSKQLKLPSSSSSSSPLPLPPPTESLERDLHVLYAFMSVPSINFFAAHMPSLESRVLKSLLHPLGVSLGLNTYQKRLLGFPAFLRPSFPGNKDRLHHHSNTLASLQSVALDLLLSLFTFESLKQSEMAFATATPHLLHRDKLLSAYQSWLSNLHANLTTRLYPLNLTIPDLVAHIQDAAAVVPLLHPLLSSTSLLTEYDDGFDYFVAQLREVYMAQQDAHRHVVSGYFPDSDMVPGSGFNGQFLFDRTLSVVYEENSPPDEDISLPTLLRCLTIGYAFTLRHTTRPSLQITSSLRPFATIPSEFMLDSTPRVFRVFPNGESSMARLAGLSHGDYIATYSLNTVSLDLFSWPRSADRSMVSRVSIVLARNGTGLTAVVSVTHADAAPTVDYAALNASQRYATYDKLRETPSATFRFGYTRLK
ncbi:hypothetical protein, variant 1 [Aphanomyces astaci]|uniref:Uncharacterized protein n=1 Tax=Aphanomyces astaci TaxID=112090 RepID=W4FG01_APHAT|nr:hypothetical protein, variant 1 [Aphanomyces astaci]ETV65766.1 hypothetical protein, variant 1 [Aphanomyces astaci]|eukprot:XP_009844750.1 hypothetical protein, variant 1 [Aphanomyces astaci]